jgi:hypothetical protein
MSAAIASASMFGGLPSAKGCYHRAGGRSGSPRMVRNRKAPRFQRCHPACDRAFGRPRPLDRPIPVVERETRSACRTPKSSGEGCGSMLAWYWGTGGTDRQERGPTRGEVVLGSNTLSQGDGELIGRAWFLVDERWAPCCHRAQHRGTLVAVTRTKSPARVSRPICVAV